MQKRKLIEESKKEIKAKQEEMKKFASQENIVTINVGLKALDKQMQEKQDSIKNVRRTKTISIKNERF